jgi:hypothetical protein
MRGPDDGRRYLSPITWPPGLSREQLVSLLAGCGLDEPTMRLRTAITPPGILGLYDGAIALAAARAVVEAGGDAFAPSLAEIEGLGATWKIRELRLEGGALHADFWRGGAMAIRPTEIQILVRAKLSEKGTKPEIPPPALARPGRLVPLAPVSVGAYGVAVHLYAQWMQGGRSEPERTLKTSDKLDIHLGDGLVAQIDGDKFGFGILGDLRGHSDHVNIGRTCELLVHLAPHAVVDPYFSYWRAPGDYKRLRLPDMRINNDDPAFAFYSRWSALMYRHVVHAGS